MQDNQEYNLMTIKVIREKIDIKDDVDSKESQNKV